MYLRFVGHTSEDVLTAGKPAAYPTSATDLGPGTVCPRATTSIRESSTSYNSTTANLGPGIVASVQAASVRKSSAQHSSSAADLSPGIVA